MNYLPLAMFNIVLSCAFNLFTHKRFTCYIEFVQLMFTILKAFFLLPGHI